jgi:N-acetylglutamate synthase-like GNAT family acetyltransferase
VSEDITRVVVERAVESDAAGIEALVRGARINPTSLHWRNFVVARHPDHGLVGCGQIRDTPFTRGARELKSLVVLPEYRDGRVARDMMRALVEGERGPIYGTCVERLAPYYARLGCEIVPKREVPLYYRLMSRVAARVHRKRTGREAPAMVVLRYTPPKLPKG